LVFCQLCIFTFCMFDLHTHLYVEGDRGITRKYNIEFGQSIYKVLKKYGNSKRKRNHEVSEHNHFSLDWLVKMYKQQHCYFDSKFMGYARAIDMYDCAHENIEGKLEFKNIVNCQWIVLISTRTFSPSLKKLKNCILKQKLINVGSCSFHKLCFKGGKCSLDCSFYFKISFKLYYITKCLW